MTTTEKIDSVVLNAMEILVKEGETICSGSNGDFTEFAKENGFEVKTVKSVYNEHEEYLTAIYRFWNKEVELDEIASFLGISVDEYREAIEINLSLDNGLVNVCFTFVKKSSPLYKSIVRVTDIFEI